MRTLHGELFAKVGAELGEGPVWDERTDRLTFVDIVAGRLYGLDSAGSVDVIAELDGHLGAAVPSATPGEYLLVVRDGFVCLGKDATTRPVLSVLGERPDLRFNDAKCDPAGRCLAGTLSYRGEPAQAALFRLDPGPEVTPVVTEVGLSNGLGWSPDGTLLYYVDTLSGRVDRFRYDGDGGELFDRQPFLTQAGPDGLCTDDDGGVWIASWADGCVRRYTPDAVLDVVVDLPVPHATSCAFAGDTLVITTAWAGLDAEARQAAPQAGDLFAVRPGVTGRPANPWQPLEVR